MKKELFIEPRMEVIDIEADIICRSSCSNPNSLFELPF